MTHSAPTNIVALQLVGYQFSALFVQLGQPPQAIKKVLKMAIPQALKLLE